MDPSIRAYIVVDCMTAQLSVMHDVQEILVAVVVPTASKDVAPAPQAQQ